MTKCEHNLKEITRNDLGYNETEVVRWCNKCGAIVVDLESDGRIWAGHFKKMIFPQGVINEIK
jgi:hypothetical protein